MKKALVITSISEPTAALRAFAKGCKLNSIEMIVIGDRSSPEFVLEDCDFFPIDRQQEMPFGLAQLLPERNYARKNLGFLQAIKNDADLILESDDDNVPLNRFWEDRKIEVEADVLSDQGWVNTYRSFTNEKIWPRGFPLERINDEDTANSDRRIVHAPIQQGLTDADPDVDAIYRFTGKLPITFEERGPIAIGDRTWSPFNSQNTAWYPEAFPLLYLPSFCSFRMTDIWRSFVATRICWENGWNILFHSADVRHERNQHDLLKDFTEETIGYLNNGRICAKLEELDLQKGVSNIPQNMMKCYAEFVQMNLIGREELKLLETWFRDLENGGWI